MLAVTWLVMELAVAITKETKNEAKMVNGRFIWGYHPL
jgi:hypothetical protein